MTSVDYKFEALRIATLIMCQSATAGKGNDAPTPDEVITTAEKIYKWTGAK